MQIEKVTNKDSLRNTLIEYANNCGREAWPVLADRMQNNNFLDWERIFIATEDDRIIWFCTFTKEDWIPECNYSPFVWFIFVDSNYRWKRISEKMINAAREYAKSLWFEKLYIVSDHKWLYEKYWFEKCDEKIDEVWRSETIFSRDIE
jgi:GNAT superfamily N-acetyltransferase